MSEILLFAAAAVALVLVVVIIVALWRPSTAADGDRFSNARRITTGWAADAGTDLVHPVPGQPGTVDTSPHLQAVPHVEVVPPAEPSSDVVNIRSEGEARPQRRQRRA
jgi:hypothetical protein